MKSTSTSLTCAKLLRVSRITVACASPILPNAAAPAALPRTSRKALSICKNARAISISCSSWASPACCSICAIMASCCSTAWRCSSKPTTDRVLAICCSAGTKSRISCLLFEPDLTYKSSLSVILLNSSMRILATAASVSSSGPKFVLEAGAVAGRNLALAALIPGVVFVASWTRVKSSLPSSAEALPSALAPSSASRLSSASIALSSFINTISSLSAPALTPSMTARPSSNKFAIAESPASLPRRARTLASTPRFSRGSCFFTKPVNACR